MPILILLLLALASGVGVYIAAIRYPTAAGAAPPATAAAGEQLGKEAVRRPWLGRLLRGRLDPATATGLALTLALGAAVIGALLLGLLAYLMRTNDRLVDFDQSVGQWGADHATHWSTQLLQLVTDVASTPVTIAVIVVVAIVETIRLPNKWIAPFLLTVLLGEVVIVNTVKHLLDRVRPTFNPIAAHLGPSFPSGHSAKAAAVYAAVALVLARRRSPRTRAMLAAAAVALAVAVAISRVMLGVHWLSDVIAGLSFGWAWFAVCAIAFGGRFLNFAAPVKKATVVAEHAPGTS
jgi:membrane-associated phospholipid phosphatase